MKAPIGSTVQDMPANAKYANRWAEPRYLTIGHTFTKDSTRVDVVRPYSWVKAIHRHNEWMKKKNNELLKTIESEVALK